MSSAQAQFDAVFNILLVVIIVTLINRRLNLPQTISLIIAGIYSTLFTPFSLPQIETEVFMSVLLPPILFQETLHLSVHDFIDESDTILSYAVLGTLAMIVSISLFCVLVLGFDILESILFGIIVAPTDPVAVIGTFKSMGVVRKFQLIVAGESLLNDGVAITAYSILVSALTIGTITVLNMTRISVIAVLGGILLGIVSGYFAHLIFCWTDDKFVEVLISFFVAFGVFRTAEGMGASGVLATVIAGLIINYRCNNYGGLGAPSIEMLDALWEFVGFVTQSIAFIFIGMNTEISMLRRYSGPIGVILVFTLFARYMMVLLVAWLLETLRGKRISNDWTLGITWSGLRGGVSIVLALGVGSLTLPHSEEILALTFGVVLMSNILQGLTMSRVVRILNLIAPETEIPSHGSEMRAGI